ncbi:Werner Syndrome-like exonuclease [Citrus sinensis]|uniref:Werner Syndrome-like exonuclease n=1 Tax=Citrus sinensis TaxID=2711 RepID=A0ACB8I1R9_CITSI|nr:Werner Syndrome-like exonuclease [Citrus sinensis]
MEKKSVETEGDDDEPITEQELEIVEAIEAAYELSITRKRQLSPPVHNNHTHRPMSITSRRLPSSLVASPSSPSFSLSHCQGANMRLKYPAMRFGGQILYSRTSTEVEMSAIELRRILEANKSEAGQAVVGFDIEWKPTFRKGVLPRKAAVMQICGDSNHCYVMQIIHSGIPPSLQLLLEDSTILKVGVGIGSDAGKVYRDYNVSVKASEDLSYLAKHKIGGDSQKWGLASLTEMLVCKELKKPNRIRLGNWEADVLSKDQLLYAATDAFASWHLYQVLKSLPEPVKDATDQGNQRCSRLDLHNC